MELSNKTLDQIAFNTRAKIEEHMLIVMDESTYEFILNEPLQTNNKQFKIAITFLTGIMVFSILQMPTTNFVILPQKK